MAQLSVEDQLRRLNDAWGPYRQGRGLTLDDEQARYVLQRARYLAVMWSTHNSEEAEKNTGETWATLSRAREGFHLSGYQEAGLEKRADFLARVATGEKDLPKTTSRLTLRKPKLSLPIPFTRFRIDITKR